ncbi:MAG: hypothetical protein ACKV2T_08515 [Kofleriaceae bacterium]
MAVCAALLATPTRADACSCVAPGPPCAEMFSATVFVGKAVSTRDVLRTLKAHVTFEVIEVLRGAIVTKTVVVETDSKPSMCGVQFQIGTTYVVYAGGDPKTVLETGLCSRTHRVRDLATDEDVVFARASRRSKATKARVEGRVVIEGGRREPGAGLEVRVKGTPLSTTSKDDGTFTFELAPGTHELEAIGKGLRPYQGQRHLVSVLHATMCPRPHITMSWNAQILGRVTYADNTPASGARIVGLPAPGSPSWGRLDGIADSTGRFTLNEVGEGTWLVVVSPETEGGPSWHTPHPTTYYPGTPTAKKATPVAMKKGGLVPDIDFVVPAPHAVVSLHGDVKYANGTPVPNARILTKPKGPNRSASTIAGAKGAFEVREIAGLELALTACHPDDYRTCSEVTIKVAPTTKRIALTLPK